MARTTVGTLVARLDQLEKKVLQLEQAQRSGEAPLETPVSPWQYLVRRAHPWRQQLYIKGRNMTVRHLVGSMMANQFDEATAAANHDLPVEAIREALAYYEQNEGLIVKETEIEGLMLQRGGIARGPQGLAR